MTRQRRCVPRNRTRGFPNSCTWSTHKGLSPTRSPEKSTYIRPRSRIAVHRPKSCSPNGSASKPSTELAIPGRPKSNSSCGGGGSLSAPNEHYNSTRWRVVMQQPPDDRVDVGFVSIGHMNADMDWSSVQLRDPITPMSDFQTYVAILDMDGNSWSSRFGELLVLQLDCCQGRTRICGIHLS